MKPDLTPLIQLAAYLRPISDVDIPEDAEIFCVPVSDNWGL